MNLLLLFFLPLFVLLAYWPLLLALYIHTRLVLRREHVNWLLRTLAAILSRNLPLVPSIRAAAQEERGVFHRRMLEMADLLKEGYALATAIRISFPIVPGDVTGAIDGAERAGVLPSVLQHLARRASNDRSAGSSGIWFLVLWTAIMSVLLSTFICQFALFILPNHQSILSDFGLPLPSYSRNVFWPFLYGRISPFSIFILAAPVILVFQVLYRLYNHMRRPDRIELFAWIADTLAWFSPLRRYSNMVALARQIPLIQMALEAGNDLPAALRSAVYVDANWYARRRLLRFAAAIESGVDPSDAARRCHMPGPFRLALQRGRAGGDLGAALEYLSGYYDSLRVHWERVLASILMPLVTLLVGLAVFAVVYAVLLPLLNIFNFIIESVY